jgi:hypothetical protein
MSGIDPARLCRCEGGCLSLKKPTICRYSRGAVRPISHFIVKKPDDKPGKETP